MRLVACIFASVSGLESRRDSNLTRSCDELAYMSLGPSYVGSRCTEGGVCSGVFWNDTSKKRVISNGPKQLEISCLEATGMMIVHKRFRQRRNRITVGRINLHDHRSWKDGRVRLSVRFTAQSGLNASPFSLLFDTGASQTVVRTRRGQQAASYGYLDNGRAKPTKEILRFGADFGDSKLEVVGELREKAMLGNFKMDIDLKLAKDCNDKYIEAGIWGAGITSEFAKNVGVFAVIPPTEKFERFKSRSSAGSLVVGDVTGVCSRRGGDPVFTKVRVDLSTTHWIIDGSASVSGLEPSTMSWILDTGAQGLMFTREVYMKIVEQIHKVGGYMPNTTPGVYNEIEKCYELYSKFPVIRVQAGRFQIELKPLDYLGSFNKETGMCLMMVDHSEMYRLPNTGILGTKFLERACSIFDFTNKRVGFCHPS